MGLGIQLGNSLGTQGGTAPFTPANLANLWAWWRADQGVTLNGATVSQWVDISGNSRTLVQATAINQPTFVASDASYNNVPTIRTASAGPFLHLDSITLAQPFSVLVVGQTATAGGMMFAGGTTLGATTPEMNKTGGGGTDLFAGLQLIDPVDPANPGAYLVIYNGASSSGGFSDWLTGGQSGNIGAGGINGIGVFASGSGTFATIATVEEIIITSAVLSSADKTNLAAYIKTRTGITVT